MGPVDKSALTTTVESMPDVSRSLPWKKVAVTGAAGRIGQAVAQRLFDLGYSLVLLDKAAATHPPLPLILIDLRDRDAVRSALQGVDAVCHIGEVPNILPGMTGPEVFDANTAICRNMLDVSRELGVNRFIYTSSCQRYGYWGGKDFPKHLLPDTWPIDERQGPHPLNKYAESKVANEAQCEAERGAMQMLIYRFPWVIPLKAGERTDRHWKNGDQYLFEGFWTYLDLRDAVEAYVRGLDPRPADTSISPDGPKCEAFHFVADEIVGERPIREKMTHFLPDWPSLPADWPTHLPPVTCEKAARLLGWRPSYRMSAVVHRPAEQTAT